MAEENIFHSKPETEHTRTICSAPEIESLSKVRKEKVRYCVPEIERLIVLGGKVYVTLKQKKGKGNRKAEMSRNQQ
jgi:hypothetical protein